MDSDLTIGLAFIAGLASFLSPCVFSLVPAYVGYLGGRSVAVSDAKQTTPWLNTLAHGVAFILGFSLVFITLGVAFSAIGGVLYSLREWLAKIGGIVVILFGLHMTGLVRIKYLEYDLRPTSKIQQNRGYFSSLLLGVFFSAGWSPCVGPILGAILTLAMNGGSLLGGVKLLSAYSAGLAIPFLAAAFGIGWVTVLLRKYSGIMRLVEKIMGIILIIVGILLFFGIFQQLARFGSFIDLGL
ncbi:MAG: cytochrome c biogenesis protein CcdA [Anaerolineae bacterium]|jgi:cytochrome c-type biogenesis protein|nr:cytochrome c biogenesis protein CcdA [Anaerolineae bacterium]